MSEVHDMVRSPHPAKPFHFGPFVSLQFLIFMITLPDITPASGPSAISHHQHPSRETGGGCWEGVGGVDGCQTGLINKVRQRAAVGQLGPNARRNTDNI